MIKEIKIGGMYTVSSLWRNYRIQLDLLLPDSESLHLRFCLTSAASLTMFTCTSVWFSSVWLVQCRQPVEFHLCTTTTEDHTWKSARLRVCVYIHWSAGLLPTWFACSQAETQHSLTGLFPCCRPACIMRWWPDTIAPPSGCLRSQTSSWLASSSPCICHHTAVKWPESQSTGKITRVTISTSHTGQLSSKAWRQKSESQRVKIMSFKKKV